MVEGRWYLWYTHRLVMFVYYTSYTYNSYFTQIINNYLTYSCQKLERIEKSWSKYSRTQNQIYQRILKSTFHCNTYEYKVLIGRIPHWLLKLEEWIKHGFSLKILYNFYEKAPPDFA